MFYRKLHNYLLSWREKTDHKPLIIRGARQVGKSTLVNEFGKEFTHFISLNLEKPQDRRIFERLDQTRDIVNAIFLRAGIGLTDESTLVFLDEIQECPKAIGQLRYFFEEYPKLYFIAAGSLLEFAMHEIPSFPVGRVEQVVLHPFDFDEFLMALGNADVLAELDYIPVKRYAHDALLEHFNKYAIIGGMPEVIKEYAGDRNLTKLGIIYDNLWQSYRDDVEKYASNGTERKIIRHIMDTAPFEKDRVTLAGFGRSEYRSREIGEAIRALDMARVIQLIYPTTSLAPPVQIDIKRKPRLQFLDTGLLNHSTGCMPEMIGVRDLSGLLKGKILQHLVYQQVQSQSISPLFKPAFWVRENANSNAEVDLVYPVGRSLLPVEFKSGEKGTLRSLHQFIERSNHKYGIRLLANNFLVEKAVTPAGIPYVLMNLPYYAATRIPQYARWFVENY